MEYLVLHSASYCNYYEIEQNSTDNSDIKHIRLVHAHSALGVTMKEVEAKKSSKKTELRV